MRRRWLVAVSCVAIAVGLIWACLPSGDGKAGRVWDTEEEGRVTAGLERWPGGRVEVEAVGGRCRVVGVRFTGNGEGGPGYRVPDLTFARSLPHLRTLDLSAAKVTDADLAALEGVSGLRSVSLRYTGVTDAGLAHLARLPALESLDLQGTSVGDRGLAHLSGLGGLRTLNASATAVSDERLRDLASFARMEVLSV